MKRNTGLEKAFTPIPDDCYHALMAAAHNVKEEKILKRKMSVALVFAIVLVLAVGVALAAMLSLRDTGRKVVETEQTEGYYYKWSLESKTALAGALVELGYAESTSGAQQLLSGNLTEQDAHRVADEMMVAFTGVEISEISFMQIMEAAWGSFEKWTAEEQSWYSQLMADMNLQKDDHTLYVMPEGSVDEAEAIAIARKELAAGYEVPEEKLDAYIINTSFQVPEFAESGNEQAWWQVEFQAPETMPESERLFYGFWLYVHPDTGALLESAESIIQMRREQEVFRNDPLIVLMREFGEKHGSFHWMSHESRALWSQQIRPEILKKLADTPDFFTANDIHPIDQAAATFIYGVPGADALPEAEAQKLAERALVEVLGRQEVEIRYYSYREGDYYSTIRTYYDVTNPEKPLWKFVFNMPGRYGPNDVLNAEIQAFYGDTRPLNYKVELDAHTGKVANAFGFDWADVDTLEEYLTTL